MKEALILSLSLYLSRPVAFSNGLSVSMMILSTGSDPGIDTTTSVLKNVRSNDDGWMDGIQFSCIRYERTQGICYVHSKIIFFSKQTRLERLLLKSFISKDEKGLAAMLIVLLVRRASMVSAVGKFPPAVCVIIDWNHSCTLKLPVRFRPSRQTSGG